MRPFLRKLALASFATALVLFCSCERHKVGELPSEEEHAKPGADDHGHTAKHADADPKAVHANDGVKAGPEHAAAANPSASPMGTPAEFFPVSSPSPH